MAINTVGLYYNTERDEYYNRQQYEQMKHQQLTEAYYKRGQREQYDAAQSKPRQNAVQTESKQNTTLLLLGV